MFILQLQHHQKTIIDYPDLINDVIQNVMPLFDNSAYVTSEMKSILSFYTRKKDFVYLIKPDSISMLATHQSGLVKDFPILD